VVIRIDAHPAGKTPTNTTCMLSTLVHVCPAYASCGRSQYMTTLRKLLTWLDGCTALEKKCSRLHLSARLSDPRGRLSFSPNTTIEVVHLSQAHVDAILLDLPDSYHHHAIGTFNTCSQIPISRSLTETGGGYHIEKLEIATTLFPHFPSEGFTEPPNDPAWSQIT
jgi:hypothetical protein